MLAGGPMILVSRPGAKAAFLGYLVGFPGLAGLYLDTVMSWPRSLALIGSARKCVTQRPGGEAKVGSAPARDPGT